MSAAQRARVLRRVPAGKTGGGSAAGPVLYWMSRDQRVQDNWALIYAREEALRAGAPLAVVFCLTPGFPGATLRAYDFMLKGLQEVDASLRALGLPFFLLPGDPAKALPQFASAVRCSTVVTDFSPMEIKKEWLTSLLGAPYPPPPQQPTRTMQALELPRSALPACVESVVEVDAHNTVPLWVASDRGGGSRAIREKIYPQLDTFLCPFPPPLTAASCGERLKAWGPDIKVQPSPIDWAAVRSGLKVTDEVPPVSWLQPGESAARAAAQHFAGSAERLHRYETKRIDPTAVAQSDLSPYFHYGHVCAQTVALMARHTVDTAEGGRTAQKGSELFLEQAMVRPSICDNWCYYTGLKAKDPWPAWAVSSLRKHEGDEREHLYTEEALEYGKTHDALWNAAQHEMVVKGKMHAFLRMYWAKRILEWTPDAATAFDITLRLNDKYELDGRDPNGIVSIAWAIYGVHDAPFKPERPVTGALRPMTYQGCKSKFNVPHLLSMMRNAVADPRIQADCPELLRRCGLHGVKADAAVPRNPPPPEGERRVRGVDNPHHRDIIDRMKHSSPPNAQQASPPNSGALHPERRPNTAGAKKKNRVQ